MSNGNVPKLTGWQYITLEIAKLVIPLIGTALAAFAAKYAYDSHEVAVANKKRIKEAEKRVYDVQVHQRKMIIGSPPPEPVKDE